MSALRVSGAQRLRAALRPVQQRMCNQQRVFLSNAPEVKEIHADYAIIGGGPVGGSAAWFLAEKLLEAGIEVGPPGDSPDADEERKRIVLVHDPKKRGAHEDYSRLARLSFDATEKELEVSRKALELLDMVEEVQSMNSGAPVIPLKPGMLFVASSGTQLALACARGQTYGDDDFVAVHELKAGEGLLANFTASDELNAKLEFLYPGNKWNLPEGTMAWSHPQGYCVDPLQMADTLQSICRSYGVELVEGYADLDIKPAEPSGDAKFRISLKSGEDQVPTVVSSDHCLLFGGARSKQILEESVARGTTEPELQGNDHLRINDFEDTYITAVSTIRYKHANAVPEGASVGAKWPSIDVQGLVSGGDMVVPPIVLGQIDPPPPGSESGIDYQANFSIVAEEMGNVYKVRLSGKAGSEVIDTVGEMYAQTSEEQNAEMQADYRKVMSSYFPYLFTQKQLDFNRCVTYRNSNPKFNGYSLIKKEMDSDVSDKKLTLVATTGCYGVGVKFGPILGQAAADTVLGNEVVEGMRIFQADTSVADIEDDDLRCDIAAGQQSEVY